MICYGLVTEQHLFFIEFFVFFIIATFPGLYLSCWIIQNQRVLPDSDLQHRHKSNCCFAHSWPTPGGQAVQKQWKGALLPLQFVQFPHKSVSKKQLPLMGCLLRGQRTSQLSLAFIGRQYKMTDAYLLQMAKDVYGLASEK